MPTLKNGRYRPPQKSSIVDWKNTSKFPDLWAKPAIQWLCEHFGVDHIRVAIHDAPKRRGSGRAWLDVNRIHLSLSRRNYRENWKYFDIAWDKSRPVNGTTEAFVFLAAHEIAHISREGKRVYQSCHSDYVHRRMGGWRKKMERQIQEMAQTALDAYRAHGCKVLMGLYAKELRRGAARRSRAKSSAKEKTTAAYRLTAIERRIGAWSIKLARASAAVKRLKRSQSAIVASQRRAALRFGVERL